MNVSGWLDSHQNGRTDAPQIKYPHWSWKFHYHPKILLIVSKLVVSNSYSLSHSDHPHGFIFILHPVMYHPSPEGCLAIKVHLKDLPKSSMRRRLNSETFQNPCGDSRRRPYRMEIIFALFGASTACILAVKPLRRQS